MRNVSNDFKRTMEERRDFYCEAQITFADGTQKTLKKSDFTLSGNSIIESAESNSFPLGVLVPKQATLSIMNDDDRWSSYDFYRAKILLRTKFDLNTGITETLNIGTLTVITPETYGTTITFTAMDDCYKMDVEYATSLTFPVTLGTAVRDSCSTCGVTLLTTTFANDSYVIKEKPESLTHRQFIGLCAMIAGGNARMDEYNRLSIIPYDFSEFENGWLDGGNFNEEASPYETGDVADGGGFDPWDTGYVCDGGVFSDRDNMHILYEFKSEIKIDTDDVVITGIKIKGKDDTEYLYGKEGYVLSLENTLASGQEEATAALIGQKIVGLRFRPFTGDHVAYPLAEFMDLAVIIDRKQNIYRTVITDVDFQFYGFTTLKCSADSPIRNSSKYYGNEVKAIVAARKDTEKQLTEYDKAVQMLTNLITQSFGVFKTEETLKDGSVIYYLHDKPTLGESQKIWKMTADAFAVSSDGGETWNAGMDAEGNAVLNILSAIGINFSWARGGELILGGGTGEDGGQGGVMIVKDSAGHEIVRCDVNGITATKGTFSGALQGATGTFKGDLQAAGGTFSGSLSAASGTFTGELQAATGTFSGSLQAATGTFGGMTAEGNTLTQETPVGGSGSGTYKIIISGKGIDFDVDGAKFPSSTNGLEPEYYTAIGMSTIETHALYADTLKLTPAHLPTGGSAAKAIGISSSGNIVIMP